MPKHESDHGTSETLVVGMYNQVGVRVGAGTPRDDHNIQRTNMVGASI
jgi:hypothetical protein